jgi:hypothetical protein
MVSNGRPTPNAPILTSDVNAVSDYSDPAGYGIHPNRTKPHIRLPFSPAAWNKGIDRLTSHDPIPPCPQPVNSFNPTGFDPTPKLSATTRHHSPDLATLEGLNKIKPVSVSVNYTRPGPGTSKSTDTRKRSIDNIFDLEQDVVFEEIEDRISGQRQRVAYGGEIIPNISKRQKHSLGKGGDDQDYSVGNGWA